MNFLFLKDIISSPWQVDSVTRNTWLPVLKGLSTGLNIEKAPEPENYRRFAVEAATKRIIQGYYADDQPELVEAEEPEETALSVINVISLRSILTKHDQDCGPRGTRTQASRLLEADEEPNVVGHIFVIESGGGQSSAVAELSEAILKCQKPVLTWIDGCCCSAAYYIASYTKEIIASRETDMVGCIGTMVVYEGRKSKSEANDDGDVQVTIYADGSDEKNEEYDRAINDFDFAPVKNRILNPINEKFKSDVKDNRPTVSADQLKGRTYFASDVIGTLVDSVGDFNCAVDRLLTLANFKPKPALDPENENSPLNNTQQMKKTFLNVNKVLNLEVLESTEEGVFLNEEQLESIDSQIAQIDTLTQEHASVVEGLTAQVAAATQTVTEITAERDTARTELAGVIDPFNAIDPTIAIAATPEEKVQAIRTLLAAKPGVAPAQNLGEEDPVLDGADWDMINSLPHNKQVDANI